MKKIYVLLLSLGIVTITGDAAAMMRQLLRVPKNMSKKNILPHRFNSQSKINETDNSLHVLELVKYVRILQDGLLYNPYVEFDLYKSCHKPSPWHYDLNGEASAADINKWTNRIRSNYEWPNQICNDIEQTLSKQLPLWLNTEKIREFNNAGIKFAKKNIHLINEHNNFLLQYREALLILESKKSLYYTIFRHSIQKDMTVILNEKIEQLNHKLLHNNRLIIQNMRAIESNLWDIHYYEKEKRQKIDSE